MPRGSQFQLRYHDSLPDRPPGIADADWELFVAHLVGTTLTALAARAGVRHGELALRFAALDAAVRATAREPEDACAHCREGRPLLVSHDTTTVELVTSRAGRYRLDPASGDLRLLVPDAPSQLLPTRPARRIVSQAVTFSCGNCRRAISPEEACALLDARWQWNDRERCWARNANADHRVENERAEP
jgi:hypothetical protein